MARLNRNHPLPLYAQLKDSLRADILAGKLRAHQQLPSERDLCARFRVSRMTVRQALLDLTREGLIYSRIGKGTFANTPKIDQELKTLSGFSQDVQARGSHPASRVLKARIVRADDALAQRLNILPNSETVLLARLRIADKIPLAIETVHIPHARVPNLLRHDFATESLYAVLEHEYGFRLTRAEQTIEAGLADARQATLLRLDLPAPVLKMERVTYTDQGILIEHVHSIYRGDRYKFHSTLEVGN
ncbi:MAG: GntR family transcriptional regulator [Chloroflexi bacterium]|nr:GntR family transcriptional regulator [Chloroflexota bacterium]